MTVDTYKILARHKKAFEPKILVSLVRYLTMYMLFWPLEFDCLYDWLIRQVWHLIYHNRVLSEVLHGNCVFFLIFVFFH